MLGKRFLVLDTFCEVFELLEPYMDEFFFDFSKHKIRPGAIYLIGRAQMNLNRDRIRELVENDVIRVILSNPAEGSDTLKTHCELVHRCSDLVLDNRMLLIGGGDMSSEWPCLQYDSFLPKILDYTENIAAIQQAANNVKQHRPYKFLFLNGRLRGHRKYLIEQFALVGLLDQAIWTNLEQRPGSPGKLTLIHNGQDLMLSNRAVQRLPPEYEVDRYRNRVNIESQESFVKYELFDSEWGEIYLTPEPYIDTYFSVVTETVFEYPYSFRTEKIWKPMAMGHPWIAVANAGYYRDMRNLGFRTFDGYIDESFDQIDNSQLRIERIAKVVKDLCQQDLWEFTQATQDICKYNQQHLAEMRTRVRAEFPDRFKHFIKQYKFDE